MPKLIILRGNSGSGKSTVATKLREASNRKIALIEQDYVRRIIFKEKEADHNIHIPVIAQIAEHSLNNDFDVVIEGILFSPRYTLLLTTLVRNWPEHYIYYFDIPFEETLRRHNTKSVKDEFGEKEMSQWYHEQDLLGLENEVIIGPELSLQEIVEKIKRETGI